MAKEKTAADIWPNKLGPNDDLYTIVDDKTGEVKYLVLASFEKQATYVRESGTWFPIGDEFIDAIDDPDLYNVDVDVDYIKTFDEMELKPVTAAVGECPPATQDIALNLRNRKNAIDTAMYGPLNPSEPNDEYWATLADEWGVDLESAKKQRCGNCAVFVVTSEMKDCIKSGLVGDQRSDEFDMIDAAGELGYCEAFDFKCASQRTCRAWVTGGPISDKVK